MTQILDSLPDDERDYRVMSYLNATSSIQIARITNIPNWYFERVVFPGQRLMFEAPLDASLEIHTGMMASAILSDTIPCRSLILDDFPAKSPTQRRKEQQEIEYRNEEAVDSDCSGTSHIPSNLIKNLNLSNPLEASTRAKNILGIEGLVS